MPATRLQADPSKQNYVAVCALADKLFSRIREVVASQLVPTTLKVRPATDSQRGPISIAGRLPSVWSRYCEPCLSECC